MHTTDGTSPRIGDETGFGLIEVIVSAVLVVLVSLGVYAGLDGASATSGINKHRSQATQVAQQDQDRMRAMTVNELSNYRASQTTTVGGLTYTVASRADWITDSTGTATCTSGSAQANYLRISSSVTWPSMNVPPVTIESITAPPSGSFSSTQGSLAVQVRDRNGAGVSGVVVTLTGPKSFSDVTNAQGCVLWGYLPVNSGNYTVTLGKAGYVDPTGVAAPSKVTGLVGESVTSLAFDYDAGAQIQAVYQTLNGSTVVPANGSGFSWLNPNLSAAQAFPDPSPPHSSFLSPLVYPFTAPVPVWAGGACAGAQPSGANLVSTTLLPGQTSTVNLREPPINFQVVNGATPVNNATVRFTATGSGCSGTVSRTTDSTGFITDKAFPYGTYSFCYQSGTNKKTTAKSGATSLNNSTPTGIAAGTAATLDISGGFTSGACP